MKPLDGVRVVEFATLMSGPYAGLILADMGADVIKVETPDGDPTRRLLPLRNGTSACHYALNRGKRSIILDLRNPSGKDTVQQLLATADVMVENWRPGVADRLGLGADSVRKSNPRLIVASVRGFADEGPYAQDRVYDSIIQAVSGMASTQGGDEPGFVRTFVPDKLSALSVTQSVLGALLLRERTGEGAHVNISMLDVTIGFLWPDVLRGLTFGDDGPSSAGYAPRIGSLVCAGDGRWLTISAVSDPEWHALCTTIERPDLEASYPTMASRKLAGEELAAALRHYVSNTDRGTVLDALRAAGVASAPINTPTELLTDPQVVANGTISSTHHPELGTVRQVRVTPDLSTGETTPMRPAPDLGAHTDEVVRELGLDTEEVGRLRANGAFGPDG